MNPAREAGKQTFGDSHPFQQDSDFGVHFTIHAQGYSREFVMLPVLSSLPATTAAWLNTGDLRAS